MLFWFYINWDLFYHRFFTCLSWHVRVDLLVSYHIKLKLLIDCTELDSRCNSLFPQFMYSVEMNRASRRFDKSGPDLELWKSTGKQQTSNPLSTPLQRSISQIPRVTSHNSLSIVWYAWLITEAIWNFR